MSKWTPVMRLQYFTMMFNTVGKTARVSAIAAFVLAASSAIFATAFAPAKRSSAAPAFLSVKQVTLPFNAQPVVNADIGRPGPAMIASADEIDQVKNYLPKSLLASPHLASAYQSMIEKDADGDSRQEHFDDLEEIARGNHDTKEIALTFDDGPHAKYTLELLSELHTLQIPATFFVVGKQAVKFPELVQLEVIEGNEIGNHTYDHVNLTKIDPSQVPYELDECDTVVRHIIGTSPRFFRPPGGQVDDDVVRAAADHGYITTMWTEDPGDYRRIPSELILARLKEHLKPGAIVLLHDGIPQTMAMLPEFVSYAQSQGYKFVTMSELAQNTPLETDHVDSMRE
jgi:peptidoglycan/xylan/chitin deacetylase (PgdA/CDA1 family)